MTDPATNGNNLWKVINREYAFDWQRYSSFHKGGNNASSLAASIAAEMITWPEWMTLGRLSNELKQWRGNDDPNESLLYDPNESFTAFLDLVATAGSSRHKFNPRMVRFYLSTQAWTTLFTLSVMKQFEFGNNIVSPVKLPPCRSVTGTSLIWYNKIQLIWENKCFS